MVAPLPQGTRGSDKNIQRKRTIFKMQIFNHVMYSIGRGPKVKNGRINKILQVNVYFVGTSSLSCTFQMFHLYTFNFWAQLSVKEELMFLQQSLGVATFARSAVFLNIVQKGWGGIKPMLKKYVAFWLHKIGIKRLFFKGRNVSIWG